MRGVAGGGRAIACVAALVLAASAMTVNNLAQPTEVVERKEEEVLAAIDLRTAMIETAIEASAIATEIAVEEGGKHAKRSIGDDAALELVLPFFTFDLALGVVTDLAQTIVEGALRALFP